MNEYLIVYTPREMQEAPLHAFLYALTGGFIHDKFRKVLFLYFPSIQLVVQACANIKSPLVFQMNYETSSP